MSDSLEPAERMALTIAWHQVTEDRELMPNTAATCVMALARIVGYPAAAADPTTDEQAPPEETHPLGRHFYDPNEDRPE